jgi:hypothetical protein
MRHRLLAFSLIAIAGISLVALVSGAGAAPVFISSFTPTRGWAGNANDDESGTVVRIRGQNFDSVPENNEVFFSSSGSGFPNVKAKVKDTLPQGANYAFKRAIGSPGTAPGELRLIGDRRSIVVVGSEIFVANTGNHRVEVFGTDGSFKRVIPISVVHTHPVDGSVSLVTISPGPRAIAIDAKGNLYLSGRYGPFGEAVGVFDKNGKFKAFIGAGTIKMAGDIGVNDKHLYVLDDGPGAGFPKVVVFDLLGSKIGSFSGVDEGWGANVRIAVDPRGSLTNSPLDAVFYVSDRNNKAVYKYNFSIPFLKKFTFTQATDMGRIAVDKDGFLYVDLDDKGIVKVDSNGKLTTTVLAATGLTNPLRTIDQSKNLYLVDTTVGGCGCIKVYAPSPSGELIVFVPHGAKTGPIGVVRQTPSGPDKGFSLDSFVVLEQLQAISVDRVEISQGVSTYPLVAGKQTLVCVQIDGKFGHPQNDKTQLMITKPNGTSIKRSADRVLPGATCDIIDFGVAAGTTVHFYVPGKDVAAPGEYEFALRIERSHKLIKPWKKPWTKKLKFHKTNERSLLFVKVSDVPNAQWAQRAPFPWFDMTAFLRGIETFKRQYPVDDRGVDIRFAPGLHKPFLVNGLQSGEEGWLHTAVFDALWHWQLNKVAGFEPHNVVGLIDSAINHTPAAGYTYGVKTVIVSFKKSGWGSTLSHEVGHTLDLVAAGQANYVQSKNGSPSGAGHSMNITLAKEDKTGDGLPILAWNANTDAVLGASQAFSLMSPSAGTPYDHERFFESRFKGSVVDYHVVCAKLAHTTCSPAAREKERIPDETLKFAAMGLIERDGTVTLVDSALTHAAIPTTPPVPSDYEIVFLDEAGTILARDGIAVTFTAFDIESSGNDTGVFDLLRPYPNGTARVEIRFKDRILKTRTPSANSPVVSNLHVNTSGSAFPTITWSASDPDGDALTFAVYYSADNGETFLPIATGLQDPVLTWDDTLSPGSNQAVFEVIAGDGFHLASAVSDQVDMRKKPPVPAIFSPADGAIYAEGQSIRLHGSAFDAEDSLLAETQLRWRLDGTTDVGTGSRALIQDRVFRLTTGAVSLPLEVGKHTITLIATDSDGNEVSTEVQIEVVADRDRDGYGDRLEARCGSSAADPSSICTGHHYAAKFVCGRSAGDAVAPGEYFTAINVHNPLTAVTTMTETLSVALPGRRPGPLAGTLRTRLGQGRSMEIDCQDILARVPIRADFVKGFVALQSAAEVDVVAVYSARQSKGEVQTLDIERIAPRDVSACPDLLVHAVEAPVWDAVNGRSSIRATIKNAGTKAARGTSARLYDRSVPGANGAPNVAVVPVPPLAPGSSATVTFYLPYWVVGSVTNFDITADDGHQITECNEANNVYVYLARG